MMEMMKGLFLIMIYQIIILIYLKIYQRYFSKKHYIIRYLSKILRQNFNYNDYIYFIDDNYMNITDAYKLTNIKKLKVIHYTVHTKRKSNEGIEDLKSILLNVV